MKIDKLRVRPKKAVLPAPCAAEFATMLACWASSNDLGNTGTCQQSAVALQSCLRTQVSRTLQTLAYASPLLTILLILSPSQGGSKRVPKSAINYHLARFSKQV